MKYTYEYNGQPYSIDLQKQSDGTWQATLDDRTLTFYATSLADGGWLLRLLNAGDGQQTIAHVASQKDERYVHVNGRQYQLAVADGRVRRRSATSGGDLTAQMPGQVMDVLVEADERVSSGQTLVVLEAMKMEIRVNAPSDGMVMRVLVQVGDVVERGQTLVELGDA